MMTLSRRTRRPPCPCQFPGCAVKEARYSPGRDGDPAAPRTCAKHSHSRAIVPLTPAQREWVDWALTGPIAEWAEPAELEHDKDISRAEAERALFDRDATWLDDDGALRLGPVDPAGTFVADLLNMLEDLAPDVAGGYGFDQAQADHGYPAAHAITAKRREAARNAASKIREALGIAPA